MVGNSGYGPEWLISKRTIAPAASSKYNATGDLMVHAARTGRLSLVVSALKCGVNVNFEDTENGYTALFVAVQCAHVHIVSILLEHGANVEWADEFGFTPLIIAAQGGCLDELLALLDHGARVYLG